MAAFLHVIGRFDDSNWFRLTDIQFVQEMGYRGLFLGLGPCLARAFPVNGRFQFRLFF